MPRLPATAQAERRLHRRYDIQIPIEILPEGTTTPLLLETANLSFNGCSVRLALQLPVGIGVRVQLSLGTHPIFIRGRVLTRHPDFGNGIIFLEFAEDGEDRLRTFLEALSPD